MDGGALLRELVAKQNDATLAEYADQIEKHLGQRLTEGAICRALKRFGLVRKKRYSGLPSGTSRTSRPSARRFVGRLSPSIPAISSSSTKPASPPR